MPAGRPDTRAICRREDPHPGAQLSFSDADGHRFQVFITDQPDPDLATLELRHRRRARVEDRIRCGKATGLRNLPFDLLRRNQVWLELVLGAQDLTCWAQTLLLDGDFKVAEPKTLRYRLWHVAARMGGRAGRRVHPPAGPAAALLTATRCRAVPVGRPGLAAMPAVSKLATWNRPQRQRPRHMSQPSGRWTANQPQLRPPPAPRAPHEKPRLMGQEQRHHCLRALRLIEYLVRTGRFSLRLLVDLPSQFGRSPVDLTPYRHNLTHRNVIVPRSPW